ncbi:Putative CMGC/SRPK protein kinase [Rhizopus microsporus]|nr:Putative CMGC/SRPK protein kinase [Rhizopus microsporus]
MLILFGIILFLVRLWFVLPHHDNLISKKRTGHCKTCIILGSGGHTTEMMQLVKGLDLTRYTPRCYVIADNDRLSEEKAREYEQEMKKIFELLTGEFLFDPRAGSKYNKDDDHLAQILELLRTVPKILITGGEFSREFFDRSGKLKHIKKLRYRRLRDVLHDTFLVPPEDADAISAFLLPMLEIDMTKRASASQMLSSEWLKNV